MKTFIEINLVDHQLSEKNKKTQEAKWIIY